MCRFREGKAWRESLEAASIDFFQKFPCERRNVERLQSEVGSREDFWFWF